MFILYDVVFLLYSLLYFPYLILTKRWHRDFGQRFGVFPKNFEVKLGKGKNVWIHAVSVGEVMAIEGFIQQLKIRYPDHQIVCSVTTKTGYELAQQRLSDQACVIAAPLDFSWVVDIFTAMIKPRVYIAAETEIWPNLFARLHKDQTPIAIINGRISDRSFGRYQKIKFLLKTVLNHVSIFAMQSQGDAARIISLGAPAERVHQVGNIKFDNVPLQQSLKDSDFNPAHPVWIAGSTHPGEEKIILDAFKQAKANFPDWQLMIAPRHVERTEEIIDLVKAAGFNYLKFSDISNKAFDKDAVIVVDTIGHLRSLYAHASLVFVGKSLCVGGGHNVIEPAMFGKAIIIGPMMANFRDIVASFKAEEALVQVNDVPAFEAAVKELMGDAHKRNCLGKWARMVIDNNQGATERTLTLIEPCL